MFRRNGLAIAVALLLAAISEAGNSEKIKVLIVDGQNNHNWKAMTPPMRETLLATGRFAVDVVTSPEPKAAKEAWASFQPDFGKYDVVLSNYNGQSWPRKVEKNLEEYVANGGGLVIIHAANNAFSHWGEWNKMIGLGWRGNGFGDRVTMNDSGKIVRTPPGKGPGAGHGPQHEFTVITRDREHPVLKGMPMEWLHAKDELYHGQRGPAANMTILATSYSAKEKGGTGEHEPMIWVIPYGKGRVFTTVMGHVMGKETTAIRCVGFQSVMCRGCEWAATNKVTLPVPQNFPTAQKTSLAP